MRAPTTSWLTCSTTTCSGRSRIPSLLLFIIGERFGPEPATADKVCGFRPGNGVPDVHMNQGNSGRLRSANGVLAERWPACSPALRIPLGRHLSGLPFSGMAHRRHHQPPRRHRPALPRQAGR
nr:DUF2278 family protein [Streptomyces sp. NBC_00638]